MLKTGFDQLGEGAGAVVDRVFHFMWQFAEGAVVAFGNKHRIIAKSVSAARRPDELAANLAAEKRFLAVEPGECQHGDKRSRPVLVAKLAVDTGHRDAEVAARAGPACGIDARRTV